MRLRLDTSRISRGQFRLLKNRDPVVLMAGGYGSGKTTALALKLLQLKYENPRAPGIIVSQTWKSLWSITMNRIMETMRKTLPPDRLPVVRGKGEMCYLDFGDGVPVFLRSGKNPDSIDGLDAGWAIGDELRYWPKKSYEVLLGRTRVPCALPQIAFASTPEMNWMAAEFDVGKAGRALIRAPTIENAHNLAPGYIENLKRSFSRRLQKAVIEGIFTVLEGAVYDALDPDFWNSEWVVDHKYDPTLQTYIGVDPGYRRSSWHFWQETAPCSWVLFDQLQLDETSDLRAVELVNAKGYQIDEMWTDPAADAKQSALGMNTAGMLRSIKMRTPRIRHITGYFRDIAFGVERMRTLFGDPEIGLPIHIKVARHLKAQELGQSRGFVRSHLAYRYPELKDGRAVQDIPLKDGLTDHDCLTGDTEIYTEHGWAPLAQIDRAASILTPSGIHDMSRVGLIRRRAPVYGIETKAGATATGDHQFLVAWRCGCGCEAAGVSWQSVLEVRQLLLAADTWGRPGISTPSCLVAEARVDPRGLSRPSRGRRSYKQLAEQLAVHQERRAQLHAHEHGGAQVSLAEQYLQSHRSSARMAQIQGWARMAPQAWGGLLEGPTVPGVYLPNVWQAVRESTCRRGEVLPPELQGDGSAQASWYSDESRVSGIVARGVADVYCPTVPGEHSFLLRSGAVSSNCDAARYFGMGMFATKPQLRRMIMDQNLKAIVEQGGGWKPAKAA